MQRRGYIGLVATAGLAGCIDTAWNTAESATGTHGPRKEFGVGSPGFESAGWTDQGLFEVTFVEDHDTEGWGIRYHAHTDADDNFVTRAAPQFSGTKTVDLIGELASSGARPPSGEYNIIAYDGSFSDRGFSLIGDELGSVSFYIQPELELRNPEITDDYKFRATIENKGNSPCLVDSVTIRDTETNVGTRVPIEGSREVVSNSEVFPTSDDDKSCMELLEDFRVQINTVTKQGLAVEMQEEYESERRCTVRI